MSTIGKIKFRIWLTAKKDLVLFRAMSLVGTARRSSTNR